MKEKIKELFKQGKIDSALLCNFTNLYDLNFFYFSQLPSNAFDNNFLILKSGKKPVILTSVLEFGYLKKQKQLTVKKVGSEKELAKQLKKHLKGKRIGLNLSFLPHNSFLKLKKKLKGKKFVDISKQLDNCRETKTRKEIAKMQKAISITEKTLNHVPKMFRKSFTEKQFALQLEALAKKLGADNAMAFNSIIAFGKNGSIPHHVTGKSKIRKGELVLIDFGAKFENYCADLTRTFVFGKASEKQKKAYEIVKEAQEKAIAIAKPGVKASDLFNAANSVILKKLKQKMLHPLGHGLGLEVHDFPSRMGEKTDFILREGMVLTFEPGYYVKNFGGIRIEDDILITKNGCRRLSSAPKKLIEL